jgi:hypothetical protein
MMLDWNLYLKRLTATIGQIATASPEFVRGYRAVNRLDSHLRQPKRHAPPSGHNTCRSLEKG